MHTPGGRFGLGLGKAVQGPSSFGVFDSMPLAMARSFATVSAEFHPP
jgi:hypothetical protein